MSFYQFEDDVISLYVNDAIVEKINFKLNSFTMQKILIDYVKDIFKHQKLQNLNNITNKKLNITVDKLEGKNIQERLNNFNLKS